MKNIAIIGQFSKKNKEVADGQTVKTVIFTKEIESVFCSENIEKIDTSGWKKNPVKLFYNSIKAAQNCKDVLFFTDQGGIKVFPWLLNISKKKNTKIHYVVIGGWLPEWIKDKKVLKSYIKKLDYIYVETATMKKALDEQGFDNVYIVPNCKRLDILLPEELTYSTEEPFKLCTFSRVMKEKGIEDAVEAVKKINGEAEKTVYELDIYGQVDPGQTEWFEELKKDFPEYIQYKGCVSYDKSTEILKNCFALLFPTYFFTEGIPGTIIDAYAAGTPVISSKWASFEDVIDDGVTGIGFEFGNKDEFIQILEDLKENCEKLNGLKENCLKKAEDFKPENVITIITSKMD